MYIASEFYNKAVVNYIKAILW